MTELTAFEVSKLRDYFMNISAQVKFIGGRMDGVVLSLRKPFPKIIYRIPDRDVFVVIPENTGWERYALMITASGYCYIEDNAKRYQEKITNS